MFALATDTACDLSFDYLEKEKIDYVGFTVTIDGKEYHTQERDVLPQATLLKMMNSGKKPMTSQVNVGQFTSLFEKYAKEGRPVLYLAFSSGLSGTYTSAMQAKKIVEAEHSNAEIKIIDTKAAANGMAILLEKAVAMRNSNETMEATIKMLEKIVPRVRSWFTVDDLHHLQRGGRISKATAVLGTMLNVKPIMDVDPDGKLRAVSKTRGRAKALKYLVDQTLAELDLTIEQKIFINYSGERTDAQIVAKMLRENSAITNFEINPLGPTITTHTGGGTIAVFSIAKDERK